MEAGQNSFECRASPWFDFFIDCLHNNVLAFFNIGSPSSCPCLLQHRVTSAEIFHQSNAASLCSLHYKDIKLHIIRDLSCHHQIIKGRTCHHVMLSSRSVIWYSSIMIIKIHDRHFICVLTT